GFGPGSGRIPCGRSAPRSEDRFRAGPGRGQKKSATRPGVVESLGGSRLALPAPGGPSGGRGADAKPGDSVGGTAPVEPSVRQLGRQGTGGPCPQQQTDSKQPAAIDQGSRSVIRIFFPFYRELSPRTPRHPRLFT